VFILERPRKKIFFWRTFFFFIVIFKFACTFCNLKNFFFHFKFKPAGPCALHDQPLGCRGPSLKPSPCRRNQGTVKHPPHEPLCVFTEIKKNSRNFLMFLLLLALSARAELIREIGFGPDPTETYQWCSQNVKKLRSKFDCSIFERHERIHYELSNGDKSWLAGTVDNVITFRAWGNYRLYSPDGTEITERTTQAVLQTALANIVSQKYTTTNHAIIELNNCKDTLFIVSLDNSELANENNHSAYSRVPNICALLRTKIKNQAAVVFLESGRRSFEMVAKIEVECGLQHIKHEPAGISVFCNCRVDHCRKDTAPPGRICSWSRVRKRQLVLGCRLAF